MPGSYVTLTLLSSSLLLYMKRIDMGNLITKTRLRFHFDYIIDA